MAVARGKAQVPVGSLQWISNERDQASEFVDQEIEDFTFSTRNEVEWLNEHMAEILSSTQINVAEIFKTPGKLRGKTPRTARKRNPLEARAPLTDVFSTNIQYNSPTRPLPQFEDIPKPTPITTSPSRFQIQDENAYFPTKNIPTKHIPTKSIPTKHNTDSGYHGMTEDEMEIEENAKATQATEVSEAMQIDASTDINLQTEIVSDEGRSTESSFHSAREDITSRYPAKDSQQPDSVGNDTLPSSYPINDSLPPKLATTHDADEMNIDEDTNMNINDRELEASVSSSGASSPEKHIVRKASLTFASLPAREPLATKKSIGNRVSRTSQLDASKVGPLNRGSYFGRYTGGKSLGVTRQGESDDDGMDIDDSEGPGLAREESDGDGKMAKLHNKSSTQRLHDRINLLGKTQPPRPTKSIPAVAPAVQPQPEIRKKPSESIPTKQTNLSNPTSIDDDDWIMSPVEKADNPTRPKLNKSHSVDVMEQINGKESIGGAQLGMDPRDRELASQKSPLRASQVAQHPKGEYWYGLKKATSTTILASPSQPMHDQGPHHQMAISVSNSACPGDKSTTPAGSPSKFHLDGPLSASKSKLQSIMKSARGLFASSAGASAQAKMDTLSPTSLKMVMENPEIFRGINGVIGGAAASSQDLYLSLPNASQAALPESPPKGRKTRSSTEKEEKKREKEAIERQRHEAELAKAREQERIKATKAKEQLAAAAKAAGRPKMVDSLATTSKPIRQSPRRLARQDEKQISQASEPKSQMAPPSRPHAQTSQSQKPKEVRRPVKPAKEVAGKARLPPVSIRVGTMSQRVNTTLASNLGDSLGPSQQKVQVATKKGSNASIQTTTSTNSFKSVSSTQVAKPQALIAAERKKEQDEKEALRKQEHKREIERKRAAAKEETQRREQKQREDAEKQREKERALVAEQEAKKISHKQAVEKRRLELMKKDQQREPQRVVNDLAHALHNEQPQHFGNSTRADMGPMRPASRMDKLQDFPRPPSHHPTLNTSKAPIKRVFDPDNEDELSRPSRPQAGQNYQQQPEGKRRKTFDLDDDELFGPTPATRPAMAPPIRQSNIRKIQNKPQDVPKTSIFHGNYPTAPPPAHSHAQGQSLLQTSTTNQAYQQHSYNNTRPTHPMDMAKFSSAKIPFADAPNPPAASSKTPMQSNKQVVPTPSSTKSSPMYINGENIHLDDIPTDSEDEDSEDERERKNNMPDWVRTPNLFEQLGAQERLNADAVFGPVPALNMEEMFKDKSRHHRFRSRTSSANWFGTDRLTEDEIRRDNAAREKMRKDGGWSYGL